VNAAFGVTWVKVDKPVFDLGGVILSSLGFAGMCAAGALVLGICLGVFLIRRRLRRRALGLDEALIQLDLHSSTPIQSSTPHPYPLPT
jgi:hypothetical protein